ncbi:hypothetical protein PENSPDRAFT_655160 [Peniophora sp. CONT]|nr:hypothetical protein PENSPDRAFT_655160 [Peniophora sp. CONT]
MPTDVANLPADIVCEVFMQAASTDPPRFLSNYERRRRTEQKWTLGWIYLTHVCHGWRLIGLDLAPLWAALVTFFPSPSIADELLSRSRDCDLRLDLQSIGSGDLIHMETWVSQHLDRASQLTVVGKANRDVFREKQLSTLRTLIIRYGRQTPGIEIDAPGLREVHLSEGTVLFRSTMPHLTALEISHVYYTAAEMLDVFRCVPFLERLRIFHGTGRWSGTFPHTIIELQHLAVFDMHASSTEAFLNLWEHLSVPPSVTVKLVTNDIPDVSILLSSLHSQLGWPSYDNLIIFSSGFSLTCGEPDPGHGERVSGLKWLFASDRDLGLIALDLLEQLRLHLAIANIHHCELELPSILRELDCAKGDPVALRLDVALHALGVALKNTTALALQGFEPDPALLRGLAPRGSSTPFPHLHSLLLGKHQSSWVAQNRLGPGPKVIETDWALVEATLTARKQGGVPVQRLVLAGQWCIREKVTQSWTSQWSRHSVRCRDMNLVMEVEDERVLETICDSCNIPELETVSSDQLEEELGTDEWGSDEEPDSSEDEE